MTVVVAVTDGSRVEIAADSMTVDGAGYTTTVDKLVVLPDRRIVAGAAGRAAVTGLLASALRTADDPTVDTADDWAQNVAVTVSAAAVEAGLTDDEGGPEFQAIVAWEHRMWLIGDRCALPVRERYAAVGSGAGPALGAMHVLERSDFVRTGPPPVVERPHVHDAVKAACRHVSGVGGPIKVAST